MQAKIAINLHVAAHYNVIHFAKQWYTIETTISSLEILQKVFQLILGKMTH